MDNLVTFHVQMLEEVTTEEEYKLDEGTRVYKVLSHTFCECSPEKLQSFIESCNYYVVTSDDIDKGLFTVENKETK